MIKALVWQPLEGSGALPRSLGLFYKKIHHQKVYKEDGDKMQSGQEKGNSVDKISGLDRRKDRLRTTVRKQRHQAKWELMKA